MMTNDDNVCHNNNLKGIIMITTVISNDYNYNNEIIATMKTMKLIIWQEYLHIYYVITIIIVKRKMTIDS